MTGQKEGLVGERVGDTGPRSEPDDCLCNLLAQVDCVLSRAVARRSLIAEQVLEIMRRTGRHCWTLDEIQDDLARRGLAPNQSSVFRAVCGLERAGTVVRVPLGDGRGHYEVTSEHHDHLVCDACGRVESLTCSIVADLASQVRVWSGFLISGHQLVLSGTCGTCAGGAHVAPQHGRPRSAARAAGSDS
ncbi:MAG: transcriptional repressor [Actinomycetota bacterium]|nr:transcriptional repressor [Actinomycetota bacterium]